MTCDTPIPTGTIMVRLDYVLEDDPKDCWGTVFLHPCCESLFMTDPVGCLEHPSKYRRAQGCDNMDCISWQRAYDPDNHYHLDNPYSPEGTIMLQYTEDSAHLWAGPYPGNYAHYRLIDARLYPHWKDYLLPEAVLRQTRYDEALKHYEKDLRRHEQATAAHSTSWRKRPKPPRLTVTPRETINLEGTPTLERPYVLRQRGNDDTSYTACFETEAAALEHLALLEACQPLNFEEVMTLAHYEYTN